MGDATAAAGIVPMGSLLMTVDEVAADLKLGRATVYQLMGQGQLRSVCIGRSRRIPRSAMIEFVERLQGEGSGILAAVSPLRRVFLANKGAAGTAE